MNILFINEDAVAVESSVFHFFSFGEFEQTGSVFCFFHINKVQPSAGRHLHTFNVFVFVHFFNFNNNIALTIQFVKPGFVIKQSETTNDLRIAIQMFQGVKIIIIIQQDVISEKLSPLQ